MSFSKKDMLNIRSCIKKRGTISQRQALARWEKTTGYLLRTEQFEEMRKEDKNQIAKLQTILCYTRLFIRRNNLNIEYEKELKEFIGNAS